MLMTRPKRNPADLGGRYRDLCASLASLRHEKFNKIQWMEVKSVRSHEMRLRRGKTIDAIQSSKFCPSQTVQLYNEIKTLASELGSEKEGEESSSGGYSDPPSSPSSKRPKIESPEQGCNGGSHGKKAEPRNIEVTSDNLPTEYSERVFKIHPEFAQKTKVVCFRVNRPELYLDSILCSKGGLSRGYLRPILQELKTASRGDQLLVINFPLLTRLTTGFAMLYAQVSGFSLLGIGLGSSKSSTRKCSRLFFVTYLFTYFFSASKKSALCVLATPTVG